MNIDQLLSLDTKNDRSTTDHKASPVTNNQMAFDFLSNYSNSNQLLKATSVMNSGSLIEHFLKNPMFTGKEDAWLSEQPRNPFAFSPASNGADKKPSNGKSTSPPDDENGYQSYFERLLMRTELCNHPGIRSNAKHPTKPVDKQLTDKQPTDKQPTNKQLADKGHQANDNLVTAMANSNGSISYGRPAAGLDVCKAPPDNALRRTTHSYRPNSSQTTQRPPSEGSLSISSIDSDCDYSEMSKQLFQPKANCFRTTEGSQQAQQYYSEKRTPKPSVSRYWSRLAGGSSTLFNASDVALNQSVVAEYQDWATRTYGDSAKTKTVTQKKYQRIVRILNGEEPNNVENSKFRFWVKSKGFRLGALSDDQLPAGDAFPDVLYVPCIKSAANGGTNQHPRLKSHSFIYKKVAVVEMFFKIIYGVHVEMEGKAGKHAGQKRTYRAVAEMYAFLPREAVTRFLMSCKDCQKRMHLQINPFHKTLTINATLSPSAKLAAFSRTNGGALNDLNTLNNRNSLSSISGSNSSKSSPTDLKELLRSASLDSNALTSLANNLIANGACSMNGRAADQRPTLSNRFGLPGNNSTKSCNNQFSPNNPKNALESLKSGHLTTAEYLKQINLLSKTGSVLELNSLMCNNGFNYLADSLSQGRELIETLSSDLNEELNEEMNEEMNEDLESNVSTRSLGIDEDEDSVVEDNANDKYLDSAHPGDHLNRSNSSDDVQIEQANSDGQKNRQENRQENCDRQANSDRQENTGGQTNNGQMPAEDADDQQINQTLSSGGIDKQPGGDERKRKWSGDCSDFEANEAEKRPKIENRIDEEASPVKIKQEEEESKEDVFEFNSGANEFKEEDDSEDDEENGKLTDDNVDPDRLKAFNMFVRLFIDENLDRSVPISRQPKEKIHAIIDSCKRQFPELAHRARKRIRTYLKSCRRTKKIQNLRKLGHSDFELRNMLGAEPITDTSPPNEYNHLVLNREIIHQPVYHLNSAAAERILSNAFDNEVLNARRIQDGLSPLLINVDQNNPLIAPAACSPLTMHKSPYQTFNSSLISRLIGNDSRSEDLDRTLNRLNSLATNSSLENLKIANKNERSLAGLLDSSVHNPMAELNSLTHSKQLRELLSVEQVAGTPLSQLAIEANKSATSDLVARIKSNERFLANLGNLNPKELVQIRQLITGYRESAAFLLRSAQELEYLLFKQRN